MAGITKLVRYHLLWSRMPTPFISVFSQYWRALDCAQMLEQNGYTNLHIIVIDTFEVPQGRLWNAYQIATDFGFPAERLQFLQHAYPFYGSVGRE